jgi:hypothetical protein
VSTIRAGDAVVIDTRSRDRRLRGYCLCEARRLRKAAREAHAHAERLSQASAQMRSVAEALKDD